MPLRPAHYRLLLAGIVLVTFARVCANEFGGWDDNLTIYRNPSSPWQKSFLSPMTRVFDSARGIEASRF